MGFHKEDLESALRLGYLDIQDQDRMLEQMQSILGHIDRLNRLDLKDVEPYFMRSAAQMPMRKDELRQATIDIAINGPQVEQNCFRVPRILES